MPMESNHWGHIAFGMTTCQHICPQTLTFDLYKTHCSHVHCYTCSLFKHFQTTCMWLTLWPTVTPLRGMVLYKHILFLKGPCFLKKKWRCWLSCGFVHEVWMQKLPCSKPVATDGCLQWFAICWLICFKNRKNKQKWTIKSMQLLSVLKLCKWQRSPISFSRSDIRNENCISRNEHNL